MNIFEEAAALKRANRIFALAVITRSKGSTPRSSARMLVRDDGTTMGTVGGGPVELYVIEQSKEAIKERKSRTCDYSLTMRRDEGMHCGGEMSFYIDVEVSDTSLLLVGAGHVNQAVAKAAVLLGFSISVADDRKKLLKEELFPREAKLLFGKTLHEAVDQAGINEYTYIIVATGNEDTEGLKAVVGKKPYYLAMLGSRTKALSIKKRLLKDGYRQEDLNRVICPAGLDIGAESPAEIAISMISQMVMFKTGSSGREFYPSAPLKNLVVVRGAGDIASGTISRLHNAGYPVLALETDNPTVIRRTVSFAEAIHEREMAIEEVKAELAGTTDEIRTILASGHIAVAVDPDGKYIKELNPAVVVDAILAKKNLGTSMDMADLTIALGPGFDAGTDVHIVIETARGHSLGKIITNGPSSPNTGIPGNIEGVTEGRIVRAPAEGIVKVISEISSIVTEGDIIARVGDSDVLAPISGMVRGMIRDGMTVTKGLKMGDIDPRGEKADYTTISDKARAIGGSVLEILLSKKICP